MKGLFLKTVIFLFAFINLCAPSRAQETFDYDDLLQKIKSGENEIAFMALNDFLREYPYSKRAPEVRFGIAEYFLDIKDFRDGINKLAEYIQMYPEETSAIFAKALLYKALQDYNSDPALVEKIKEIFFAKSLFLVFSEAKTKNYTSIFGNVYQMSDYLDRVEVYKNDEPFLKITP